MLEVSKTLRLKWYRIPISHNNLKELSQRNNFRGSIQSLGHLGCWGVTGLLSFYFFYQQLWILFLVFLFIHGTIGSHFKHANHELCHNTVFRTKSLNLFFLRIFSLLGWFNFHIYKMSHTYHHRYTLFEEADREDNNRTEPSLSFFYLFQLFTINFTGGPYSDGPKTILRQFFKISLNQYNISEWVEDIYKGQTEERMKATNWARFVLIFHGVFIMLSIGIGEPILAVIISGHVLLGNWHHYFLNITQHIGLRSNVTDFRKCARTIKLNPVSEFFYWYMNWHIEHHMFAGVPCYNLKKLHKIVAGDMPKPKSLYGAWKEMLETWSKQQENPQYEFDTPCPPQRKKSLLDSNDPLLTSIGDLTPKKMITV